MRVVFMGSPDFAVPALRALLDHHEVVLVVTQPDKRAGRGKRMAAPPVKEAALAAGVPVIQPKSVRRPEFAERLRAVGADVGVVVAYGKILPKAVLDVFPQGCINIHGSLLPRYRGAAPIQWAIIRGETETGVTIMRMDQGMDTGPVFLTRTMSVLPDDTAGSLFERMAPIGALALLDALDGLESGTLVARAQDHDAATYAPMLTKNDGIIDWHGSARAVADRIRGVDPWPGAETAMAGERLKLFGAEPVDTPRSGQPGEVLGLSEHGLLVACGSGVCAVRALQAPGRRRLTAQVFTSGRAIPAGTVFTNPRAAERAAGQQPAEHGQETNV
jgi:methionyl-tRNA formyltransferase